MQPAGREREREREREGGGGRAWGCHHRYMALQRRISTCGGPLCTIEGEAGPAVRAVERERGGEGEGRGERGEGEATRMPLGGWWIGARRDIGEQGARPGVL